MYCGRNDPLEYAIANEWYDPYTDEWDSEEHKKEVHAVMNDCPVVPEGVDPYSLPYPLKEKKPFYCPECHAVIPHEKEKCICGWHFDMYRGEPRRE